MKTNIIFSLMLGIFLLSFISATVTTTLVSPTNNSIAYTNPISFNATGITNLGYLTNASLYTSLNGGAFTLNQTPFSYYFTPSFTVSQSNCGDSSVFSNQLFQNGTNYVKASSNNTTGSGTGNAHEYVYLNIDGSRTTIKSWGKETDNSQHIYELNITGNSIIWRLDGGSWSSPITKGTSNRLEFRTSGSSCGSSDGQINVNWIKLIKISDNDLSQISSSTYLNDTQFNLSTLNSYSAGSNITWNVKYCATDGTCAFAPANYSFSIDSSAPTISVSSPTSIVNYGKVGSNLLLNFSATDTNLDKCWYNYNGTNRTISCTASAGSILSPSTIGTNNNGNTYQQTYNYLVNNYFNTKFNTTQIVNGGVWTPWFDSDTSCSISNLKSNAQVPSPTMTNNILVNDEFSELGRLISMSNNATQMEQFYNMEIQLTSVWSVGTLPAWQYHRSGNTITNDATDTASDSDVRTALAFYYASENTAFTSGNRSKYLALANSMTSDFITYDTFNSCKNSGVSNNQICTWLASGKNSATSGFSSNPTVYTGYYPDAIKLMQIAYAQTGNANYLNYSKDFIEQYLTATTWAGGTSAGSFKVAPTYFTWNIGGAYPVAVSQSGTAWDSSDAPRTYQLCDALRYANLGNIPNTGAYKNLTDYCTSWVNKGWANTSSTCVQYNLDGTCGTSYEGYFSDALGGFLFTNISTANLQPMLDLALGHFAWDTSYKTYDYTTCYGIYQGSRPATLLASSIGLDGIVFPPSNSNLANFTLTNQKNLTVYANDTAGNLASQFVSWNYNVFENSRSINSSTYETATESYILNETDSGSLTGVSLILNGTNYPMILSGGLWSKTLDIPSSYVGTQTPYFNFTYAGNTFNSDTSTQVVNPINFSLCGDSNNISYLNFTFLDESTLTSMNATISSSSFIYYLGTGTQTKTLTYSTASNFSSYAFCLNPGNRTLFVNPSVTYSATYYPTRFYTPTSILSLTNSTLNQTLYLLYKDNGIYVTFIAITQSNTPIPGATITIVENISGSPVTIAQGITDSAGSFVEFLNPNNYVTVTASKVGYGTSTNTVKPTQSTYTMVLSSTNNFTYISNFDGLQWGIFPAIGPISPGVQNFGFNISSQFGNITGCQFQLLDLNKTVITSSTTIATNGSFCSVFVSYDPIAQGYGAIKGRLLINQGSGYQILEEDAPWVYLAINSTGMTFLDFFRSINSSNLGPQYFSNGCVSDTDTVCITGHQQYTYVVFFFLFAMIVICIINFSGFDFSSPGSMIIFLTLLIYMASYGNFLNLSGSIGILGLGTPFAFLNQYFIAVLATMFSIGYIGRVFTS